MESIEDLSLIAVKSEITKLAKLSEWIKNAFENYSLLKDMGGWPEPAGGGPKKHQGEPLLLVGSGYSLDLAMPWIRKWDGKIMCGPSQVATLWNMAGKMPHYIVGHDSSSRNKEYLRLDQLAYGNTTLLTSPTWDPETLKAWIGAGYKTMLFRLCPIFNESHVDHEALSWKAFVEKYKPKDDDPIAWYLRDLHTVFFKEALAIAYQNIHLSVMSCADTPSQSLILADLLGFGPIYLVGIDHGFVDNMTRCTMYVFNDDTKQWVSIPPVKIGKPDYISENGIATDTQFATYKIVTIAVARAMSGKIFEVSVDGKYGIDNFFPRCTPDEMMFNTADDHGETKEARAMRAQMWLNSHNKGTFYQTPAKHTNTQWPKEINADGTLKKD